MTRNINFELKESNFMFMFLVKSYTTLIHPNFINKVAQKAIFLVHTGGFRTRHQLSFDAVTCYTVVCPTYHD